MDTPNDIDRAAIEEHAQRTVEQAALRKVRKRLDEIERAEIAKRWWLRYALMLCLLLAVLGAWFFWELIFGASNLPKQPPMKVPSAVVQSAGERAQATASTAR